MLKIAIKCIGFVKYTVVGMVKYNYVAMIKGDVPVKIRII